MEPCSYETYDHVVKYKFTWTIQDFTLCSEEIGESLTSPTFSTGVNKKLKWCLLLCPAGFSEDSRGYLSVYLELLTSYKPEVWTKFKFEVLDAMGQAAHISESEDAFPFMPGDVGGFEFFVRRHLLLDEADDMLPEDRLTIRCEVSAAADSVCEQSDAVKVRVPECCLSDDLGLLFENQKFSDITLSACGCEFQAHKAILAARSPVFAAMFEHEMEEKEHNSVKIIDVDHEVLREMLHFIYTGRAPNLEKMADDLLYAADKYLLERLKVMCEEALCRNLSIENAVDILILADLHSADQLKAQSIDFINMHAKRIMKTPTWKSMIKSHPYVIAELYRVLATQEISRTGPSCNRIKRS